MGPDANYFNPTTFPSKTEDRKCEKLWTLPMGYANVESKSLLATFAQPDGDEIISLLNSTASTLAIQTESRSSSPPLLRRGIVVSRLACPFRYDLSPAGFPLPALQQTLNSETTALNQLTSSVSSRLSRRTDQTHGDDFVRPDGKRKAVGSVQRQLLLIALDCVSQPYLAEM